MIHIPIKIITGIADLTKFAIRKGLTSLDSRGCIVDQTILFAGF